VGVVDLLQVAGNIPHHLLETLGHVVQGAVGENHGILKQAVSVKVTGQICHWGSPLQQPARAGLVALLSALDTGLLAAPQPSGAKSMAKGASTAQIAVNDCRLQSSKLMHYHS
jgi:hypothetical protein